METFWFWLCVVTFYAIYTRQVLGFLLRRRGNVSYLVFGASVGLYIFAVPIELALRGEREFSSRGNAMGWETALTACFLGLVGYVVFMLTTSLLRGTRGSRPTNTILESSDRSSIDKAMKSALMVAFLTAVLLLVVYRDTVVAVRSYEANVALTSAEGSTGYFLANRLLSLAYALFSAFFLIKVLSVKRVVLVLLPALAWTVFSNDKDPVTICAVGIAVSASFAVNKMGRKARFLLGLLLAPVVIVSLGTLNFALNMVRAPSDEARQFLMTQPLITSGDPGGPTLVLVSVLEGDWSAGGGLSSIFSAAVAWLPTYMRPHVQPDLGTQFAQDHLTNYSAGQGFGFSPIAEGLLVGNLVGVLLVFVLMGVLTVLAEKILGRLGDASGASKALQMVVIDVVLSYILFASMRGSLGSIVSMTVYLVVMASVVFFVRGLAAHHNRGCRRGLNPPVSRRARAI